jgi:hypothetical protein
MAMAHPVLVKRARPAWQYGQPPARPPRSRALGQEYRAGGGADMAESAETGLGVPGERSIPGAEWAHAMRDS